MRGPPRAPWLAQNPLASQERGCFEPRCAWGSGLEEAHPGLEQRALGHPPPGAAARTPRHLHSGPGAADAEPSDVSIAMATLPQRQDQPPAAVSLCVDFVMRCQGSGACWAGWQGVGKADKSPHCIPATSSSQQGPWGGGRALTGGRGSGQVPWAGGQDLEVEEVRRPLLRTPAWK